MLEQLADADMVYGRFGHKALACYIVLLILTLIKNSILKIKTLFVNKKRR